jgi:hypothetical protein
MLDGLGRLGMTKDYPLALSVKILISGMWYKKDNL